MAFESDACAIHAVTGELLARGSVREHADARLIMTAQTFTGVWLDPGDAAVLEVFSTDRGVLTFDAVVESSDRGAIALRRLTLREAVQHRASLRVPTQMDILLDSVLSAGKETVLDPPLRVHVDDLSADGMKLRTTEEIEVGHRLRTAVPLNDRSLEVVLEVVRRSEVRGALTYGCRILDVSERDRDALFRYVLEQQRRELAQRAERR
ncbi:PilZ domain-containing protein [Actinotalea sp.]|uniref:PilZ domain-containing protein n=1 Tax=Actinotalea sp. TaxID=1872145 RepID=UPI0035632341